MRFPALYRQRVELELRFLLANLEPVEGPELEIRFQSVAPEYSVHPVFDMLEGDETPTWSGSEVADD